MKSKILITGAEGFIGSHISEYFNNNSNFEIHLTVMYNSFNSIGNLQKIFKNFDQKRVFIHFVDLTDQLFVSNLFKKYKFDYVLNLAALISVPFSFESPNIYFNNNISLTQNILNSSLENLKIKKIFQFSSSEVYGSAIYTPIDEKHPLQPQSPYSASKISTDSLSLSYYYSYSLPVTIIRPFNCYGPRQSNRGVIPTIIDQILNKNNNRIKLGNTSTFRDYTYVQDLAKIIFMLIASKKNLLGQTINIGTNKTHKIIDIVNTVNKITKSNKKVFMDNLRIRPKKAEVDLLRCDNRKLKKIIGKFKFTTFKDGLKKTINWKKDNELISLKNTKYFI